MRKETITYVDFNGVERTEDFYFHINKPEALTYISDTTGTLVNVEEVIHKIISESDSSKILEMFKQFIQISYGEKSADGKSFIKEDDDGHKLVKRFVETNAYEELYVKLFKQPDYAAKFVDDVLDGVKIDPSKKAISDALSNNH